MEYKQYLLMVLGTTDIDRVVRDYDLTPGRRSTDEWLGQCESDAAALRVNAVSVDDFPPAHHARALDELCSAMDGH